MDVLILDTETSSLSPDTGHLVEIATALYSVKHASVVMASSWLIRAESNDAQSVNGIPPELLRECVIDADVTNLRVEKQSANVACIVAHGADFDRKWFGPTVRSRNWVCSCDEIQWPRASSSRALISLALAHGLGVASAHRALDDVMTLARLFARASELGVDIEAMIVRAMRPRVQCIALTPKPWEMAESEWAAIRAKLTAAGFRFDDKKKAWLGRVCPEDVPTLGFDVRELPPTS